MPDLNMILVEGGDASCLQDVIRFIFLSLICSKNLNSSFDLFYKRIVCHLMADLCCLN